MTAKSSMHNSRMSSNNPMHTDLHFGALVVVDVDVGDREVGARRIRRPPELASNNHALDSPRRAPGRAADDVDGRTREVARESIVVEKHGAMVLGDHVEVLHQRTLGDKAEPSCTQIKCQRPLRCEATKLGTEPRAGLGCHDKICNLVCRAPIGLVGPQGRPGRPAEQAVVEKMRSEGGTSAWLVIAPFIESWVLVCPFLFFSLLRNFSNFGPCVWPHMI